MGEPHCDLCGRIAELEEENARLRDQNSLLKIDVQAHERTIKVINGAYDASRQASGDIYRQQESEIVRLKSPALPEEIGKLKDDLLNIAYSCEVGKMEAVPETIRRAVDTLLAQAAETERLKKEFHRTRPIPEVDAENMRLKSQLSDATAAGLILRRYHGGDGSVTREQAMEALAALSKIKGGG